MLNTSVIANVVIICMLLIAILMLTVLLFRGNKIIAPPSIMLPSPQKQPIQHNRSSSRRYRMV